MIENNKQEHMTEEAIKANTSTNTSSSQIHSAQSQGKTSAAAPMASAAFALSIVALACSGWLYYQSTQSSVTNDIQQLVTQQANLSRELASQALNQSEYSKFITQIQTTEHTIQNQNTQLISVQAQQNEKLLALESQLNRLNNTTKEDWKLAEAEYLIRLANQRLLLESDSSGAQALLTSADNILNELQDPIFFATRKALAKDIQALKSTSEFDMEGYYLQLSALYDSVATLPQREPSKEWQATANQAPVSSTSTTDKVSTTLANLWQSIRSLVVINYNHKPIKALLPPAEYQELVTGLQLQLDVAELALVKRETAIYQKALSRVATAVTEHFDTQAKSVTSFLASLTLLQQLNPDPELPLPRESLVAMKELMKDWNTRTSKPKDTPPEPEMKVATPASVTPTTATPEVSPDASNTEVSPDASNTEGSSAPMSKETPQSNNQENPTPATTTGDKV